MEEISSQFSGCLFSACVFRHVQLFVTVWTVAHQAPLSVEFSKQEAGVGSHSLL